MPVFIAISGYFSKKSINGDYKALHTLFICYLIGWLVVKSTQGIIRGDFSMGNVLVPPYAMWYLMSLFFMRLLLPWLSKIRGIVGISFCVALLAGLISSIGATLTLSRTFVFLPLFLIGALILNRDKVAFLRQMTFWKKALLISAWLGLFVMLIYMLLQSGTGRDIFTAHASYAALKVSNKWGMFARGIFLVHSVLTTLVFIMVFPDKKTFLAKWGQNSLSIYIFHVVVRFGIKSLLDQYDFPTDNIVLILLTILCISIVTATLFSANWFHGSLQRMIAFIRRLTLREEQAI